MSNQIEGRSSDQDGRDNSPASYCNYGSHSNDSCQNEFQLQTFTTSPKSYSSWSDANQSDYLKPEPPKNQETDYLQSSYHHAKSNESSDESDYDESLDYCRVRKINYAESNVIYKCTMDWGKSENEFNGGQW